jgi:hypothetical protein
MASDSSKLHLKKNFEEKVAHLEDYNVRDDPEYPGWTFLLSEVIKNYGICPFLNVHDEESHMRRIEWLQKQKDGGIIYFDAVKKLSDQKWIFDIENDLEMLREEIRQYVLKHINLLNNVNNVRHGDDQNSNENYNDQIINHDELVNSIRIRKEAKSQNKKVKEAWNQSLQILNYIMVKKGIDFSKYINAVYGYVIRYKPPVAPNITIDTYFESLYNQFVATLAKLNNSRNFVERQKEEAEQQLNSLIKENFQLEQIRRYHKKWSSLTFEKKEERVKSYCDWYARQNKYPIAFADTMKKFIMDKIETKELRVMDIKWDIKLGIITNVNITVTENGEFELMKRAPRILKSPRRNQKKKREEIFQNVQGRILQQRLHRLLLFEMLKGQTLKKDLVISSVVKYLHTRLLSEGQIVDYMSSKYDDILGVLKENPIV